MAAKRAPQGLGKAGKALWKAHNEDGITYRADELAILRQAARTADEIDRLEVALRDAPLIVEGSKGSAGHSPARPGAPAAAAVARVAAGSP